MMRPAVPAKRKRCSESVTDGAAREPQPDSAAALSRGAKGESPATCRVGRAGYLRDGNQVASRWALLTRLVSPPEQAGCGHHGKGSGCCDVAPDQ